VNYLSWQGRCRELFLREHAPSVLAQLREDLRLVTVRVGCKFVVELAAFDELVIRMRLKGREGNQLKLGFDYLRVSPDGKLVRVARGTQVVGCMKREGDHLIPTDIPDALLKALEPYT
jgi:enediyne biosynthesis thioesterase